MTHFTPIQWGIIDLLISIRIEELGLRLNPAVGKRAALSRQAEIEDAVTKLRLLAAGAAS